MTTNLKCDSCGKEQKITDKRGLDKSPFTGIDNRQWGFFEDNNPPPPATTTAHFDLCPGCAEKIVALIKSAKPEEVTPDQHKRQLP